MGSTSLFLKVARTETISPDRFALGVNRISESPGRNFLTEVRLNFRTRPCDVPFGKDGWQTATACP